MKKLVLFLSVCALLASAVWVGAAGDAGDPLASLSYLNGEFSQRAEKKIDQALEQSDKELAERLKNGEVGEAAATWQETRLKEGDALHGVTGTGVLLLAGRGRVTYKSGAVVDVTTGAVVPSGTNLTANHRYLTAEDTTAAYTVTSETAVVDYQGQYAFSYSDRPDYNAMAAALKSLHLFKGTFTGYGEGFDLEAAPTRLQALIMFIRVLGEEEQALAWSGTTPFKDIEKGSQAEHYVGYAYEKGYTNGYTATSFKPAGAVNASQYTEFVRRAMGYSSAANKDLSDTLLRAVNAGVLTDGDAAMLQSAAFLRAQLVYISYYALEADLPDGSQSLADRLMDLGVFTRDEWRGSWKLVKSERLYKIPHLLHWGTYYGLRPHERSTSRSHRRFRYVL